jgi:hypothetical protein
MMNAKINKKPLSKSIAFTAVSFFLPAALAAPAPASETVFERTLQNESLAAHFDVNRQLGRAWIDVELTPLDGGEIQDRRVIPEALNGLYYDQARKQVIYRNGLAGVVCAEDSSFLGTTSLKDTGQCRLSVSSEIRRVDDGFNGREETVGRVVFELPSSRQAE